MRPVALMLLTGLMLPMASCRHTATGGHAGNAHYAEVDNLLKGISDIDSLAVMTRTYHDNGDDVGEMLALKYQGNKLRALSRFNEAIVIHNQGLDLSTQLADTIEMAMALNNIGTDYRRMSELSSANGYHFRALLLCDTYSDKESDEAIKCRVITLNGIGNIEISLCNYATADSIIHEALAGEEKLGSDLGMAVNYGNLGSIRYNCGDIDSAWVYYRKSMEHNKKAGSETGMALCHLYFGKLYESDRNYAHAQEEYKKAYESLLQINDDWHRLDACLALANLSFKLGEEADARKYINEVEDNARRINSKEHLARAYEFKYQMALHEGRHNEALNYFIKCDEIEDSINGLKQNDEVRSQRITYERDRSNGEKDILNNDIARLKRMRNTMALLVVLLLLMAGAIIGALVYAMRVRSRSQRMLKQVEETRSLFFTNVVHQLRTPLSAIMGAIDDIIADTRDRATSSYTDSQKENFVIIERQGNNLLDLVDRILEVGGVRSAISNLEWRTGDAVPFIRMVVESYRDLCIERHIELSYASREKSVDIDTVPGYLKTIMGSLLENAINYSREFSKITVITWVEGKNFVIRVADTGMGINKADLSHVFEPFFRGSEAEQIVDGVGIGLTVVRDMVMAMDGAVAADSSKDQGSIFTVTLPCKHDNSVKMRFSPVAVMPRLLQRRKPAAATGGLQAGAKNHDRPAVLLIEDHADVAKLVGKVFEDKYNVYYAQDGAQGFAQVQELIPDLIVTDVKMPVMDGLELCRRVRSSSRLSHIPIIMLSARTDKEDRIRGIKAGADAYLVKPFVREEMTAWADRLVTSRRSLKEMAGAAKAEPVSAPAVTSVSSASDYEDDHVFLEQFRHEVDKKITQGVTKLDLDAIALVFKMGESQLRRRVQEATGKNVVAYVAQLRMEKAMRLLREGSENQLIGDVAEKCGYTDVAYFSRVFRQHYGMTPTQARATRGDGVQQGNG